MTPSQLDVDAQAPCTRTMVGLAAVFVVETVAVCAAGLAEAAWLSGTATAAAARAARMMVKRSLRRAVRGFFMYFSLFAVRGSGGGRAGLGGGPDQLGGLVGVGHHGDVAGGDLGGDRFHPAGEEALGLRR